MGGKRVLHFCPLVVCVMHAAWGKINGMDMRKSRGMAATAKAAERDGLQVKFLQGLKFGMDVEKGMKKRNKI